MTVPATAARSTQTVSTQTDMHPIDKDEDDQTYIQKLTTPDIVDELRVALEQNWPEVCFKHTSMTLENPLSYKDKPDIAMLLTDTEMSLDTGIYKIIGDHIPELRELDTIDANPKCLKLSTRFQKEGKWTESHLNVYNMQIKSRNSEDILTAMRTLVDTAIGDERVALSMPVVTEVDPITIRNIAEIAANSKQLKITIHCPKTIMAKYLLDKHLPQKQQIHERSLPNRTLTAQ